MIVAPSLAAEYHGWMRHSGQAELIVGGLRFSVDRSTGLELLERNALHQRDGTLESVELPLDDLHPATLHLVLGAQPLLLLEREVTDDEDAAGRDTSMDDGMIEDAFPDFGVYANEE